ncbi:leucine-rich repeat-containing G-protein coupled receptor 5-like isoform X1 [Anguilla anguilla]|uniref:leucine-rich repeat-containing G-protein coupled receptor 5-like isoform X1 n=1 Tax=Anguilla anguilla TaxID=7936 RepID=UPI0015A932FD|nr:leucine-rich repeat-containing G-protein coupled receptor 5-like isoform X1 [Anguilla anguilla]
MVFTRVTRDALVELSTLSRRRALPNTTIAKFKKKKITCRADIVVDTMIRSSFSRAAGMVSAYRVLFTLLLVVVHCGGTAQTGARHGDCPSRCHCEEDGMLLRVDCSDLGLTALPANLSVFTSYLDLSMNNLTLLPASALSNLHFLEELRLAGNDLTHVPKGAFSGLFNLKVLMLQNNQLRQVPGEALQNLRNLQSLRLDANHIYSVPHGCFDGLASLRHLWLDDNALTEVPVRALAGLSSLQAMTLALNKIARIPDHAFANLSSLVVLHLHNNRIRSLGKKSFDGLQSLETLDLNYNNLDEFPMAIKALTNLKELGFHSNNIRSIPEHAFIGNPSLLTIFFYDNPIQFVAKSAFQHLPELRTLSLNGATEITEFPDLTGTRSLQSLTITGARITSLPNAVCDQLPNLQVLDLSYNLIQHLPSFNGCEKIQRIDLHHNEIQEVLADTFQELTALRSLDLAWNKLSTVDPHAFSNLPSLIKLDLTANLLSSLPVTGLHGLTHLKLAGNEALQELFSADSFPKLRVMEMPYAFQCCAFVSCDNSPDPWDREENSSKDEYARKEAGVMSAQEDHDLEDFLLDLEEDPKSHHSVQCSPAPGPFRPCYHLFGSWLIRSGVWIIVALSLVCNALVAVTIFLSPTYVSPAKHLVGLLAVVNTLMGLSSGILAVVDALTFGSFAKYGAWWESGAGCKITGFLSVFASETCIFLLTTAALERGLSIRCSKRAETKSSAGNVRVASALCFVLSLAITVLPLLHVGEYGISSLCLPLPFGEPSSLGFMVALVLLNSLCYFVMTVTYARLYCGLEKGELDNFWDSAMIKHVAWLLFANCVLYFPVAFLSFSSLLSLSFISPEVVKSVLLVIVPLPACLNPLLYLLFNPHFKEDLGLLLKRTQSWKRTQRASLVSLNSEDAEKQSCDSTQALVTLTSSDKSEGKSPRQTAEAYRSPVPFVPCR